MTQVRSSLRVLGALALGAVIVACAPEPQPVPYSPPPPRALTITAQRRQSQRQQDKDKADCQSMASMQATSSQSWAQIFTACMGGRGYLIGE